VEYSQKASLVFSENTDDKEALKNLQEERDRLHQRIGQQSMDIDFLKKTYMPLNKTQ